MAKKKNSQNGYPVNSQTKYSELEKFSKTLCVTLHVVMSYMKCWYTVVCMQHEQTDVEFCAGTLPSSRLLSIIQLCIAAKIVLC